LGGAAALWGRIIFVELLIRRILGIFLILTLISIPLIHPGAGFVFAIFLAPLVLPLALYLLTSKGHHLFVDALLCLVGYLLYRVSLPLLLADPFSKLKLAFVTADWAYRPSLFWVVLLSIKALWFASAAFLLASSILVKIKFFRMEERRWISPLLLSLVLLVTFGLPFLREVKLTPGIASGFGWGGAKVMSFELVRNEVGQPAARVDFDGGTNNWVYSLPLVNKSSEEAKITKVASYSLQLAPPFGSNFKVTGGEILGDGIIVAPGAMVVVQYFSEEPLWAISLYEGEANYDFSWGM